LLIFMGTLTIPELPIKEVVLPPSTIPILPTKGDFLPPKERQFHGSRFLLYKQRLSIVILQI